MVANREIELNDKYDFEYHLWGGAITTIEYLTEEECEQLAELIEECFCDIRCGSFPTIEEVNDFVWFEDDYIANYLGFDSFEEIMERGEQ